MLRFMGSQRIRHNWATEQNWTELNHLKSGKLPLSGSIISQNFDFILFNFQLWEINSFHLCILSVVFLYSSLSRLRQVYKNIIWYFPIDYLFNRLCLWCVSRKASPYTTPSRFCYLLYSRSFRVLCFIFRSVVNNIRYADDTILMAESKEELKSFLMKVKEES